MQSLRVFVVPKNRKRREIALRKKSRENEQRRNTPNSGRQIAAKTRTPEFGVLQLCSKPPFPDLTSEGTFG
jgi:hypothetical protein